MYRETGNLVRPDIDYEIDVRTNGRCRLLVYVEDPSCVHIQLTKALSHFDVQLP